MRQFSGIAASTLLVLIVPLASADPIAQSAIDKAEVLEQVIAPDVEAAPPEAPITRPEAQAVDPAGQAALEDPLTCLARALYWEAKGTPEAAKVGVAHVVLNRLAHPGFPNTVCEVITDGAEQGPCQFSWWCDGRANDVVEDDAYETAREIARQALNQTLPDSTGGALYFHDRSVQPGWAAVFPLTAETDIFLFYRPSDGAAR
ncbi:cell wall hydrolase [Halomonas sp. 1513]|nr:cell wall hydrolase [Halomonas sp. 1513]APX93746.1 cell wall hydrolase [Halomonas sp. 1513]